MDTVAGPYVVDLRDVGDDALAEAGGKAVNLGRLLRGGLPVPEGFVVLTSAQRASAGGAVPSQVRAELVEAYARLGGGPVAVRSSATAEDLEDASFAGQQETFLNVVGEDALVAAVADCWASLWSERAVAYRRHAGVADEGLALAVVVQVMVDAAVAGVMFTADPVSGSRSRTSIDASPGLGEAVVSGAVNPDRFVVDTATGDVLELRAGDKRVQVVARPGGGVDHVTVEASEASALSDAEVRALVALGRRVTDLYAAPQDTEWAIDTEGRAWLTQARPITTLFPLPEPRREGRHAYLCMTLAQGLTRPITPIGIGTFRLVTTSIAGIAGVAVADPRAGAPAYAEAGQRVFIDLTPALRRPAARRLVLFAFDYMEARSAAALRLLADDPGLAPVDESPLRILRPLGRVARRTLIPLRLVQGVVDPDLAVRRVDEVLAETRRAMALPDGATGLERLAVVECELSTRTFLVMPQLAGFVVGGFLLLGLAQRLLGDRVAPGELQTVMRGLPHNPTTTMDMELWDLAVGVSAEGRTVLAASTPVELARAYATGTLPAGLQAAVAGFLDRWGDRAVAEIDLGMPRWRDDPTHVLGMVKNYVADPSEESGRARFARAEAESAAMAGELAARLHGPRRWAVAFALDRARRLCGMRESPKFGLVTMFGRARAHLQAIGDELVAAGRLDERDDVMFLQYAEVEAALRGQDVRGLLAPRREAYARELRRRHVPHILLDDGTDLETLAVPVEVDGGLIGTPASAGVVTGTARVVLDPVGAHLEPGEILVCPSTDPGWTPLFLTAGGLVMEMGGSNSHGAVVAREYGIPAVVGVPLASERIASGDTVTVDGSSGRVVVER